MAHFKLKNEKMKEEGERINGKERGKVEEGERIIKEGMWEGKRME